MALQNPSGGAKKSKKEAKNATKKNRQALQALPVYFYVEGRRRTGSPPSCLRRLLGM